MRHLPLKINLEKETVMYYPEDEEKKDIAPKEEENEQKNDINADEKPLSVDGDEERPDGRSTEDGFGSCPDMEEKQGNDRVGYEPPRDNGFGGGYNGGYGQSSMPPKKKKSSSSAPAIAVLVMCAVIFIAVIGFGAYKIYDYQNDPQGTDPTDTSSSTSSSSGSLSDTQSTDPSVIVTPSGTGKSDMGAVIVDPSSTNTSVTVTPETEIIARCFASCVEINLYSGETHIGAGSGVIYTADGYIVTNYHVVSSTALSGYKIIVTLADGSQYEGKYVCGDLETDISVIKIDKNDCTYAKIGNSNTTVIGETVYAIGNPDGKGLTITDGRISALNRDGVVQSSSVTISMTGMFLFSAPVNAGNSGGGLFNINGELIGIVNAKGYYGTDGNTLEGTAFAIPVAKAFDCINTLGANNGYIPGRAKLGVTVDINGKSISSGWTTVRYSAYVTAVSPNSSAALAGIEVGDIITSIDGVNLMQYKNTYGLLSDYDALHMLLMTYKTGDTAKITVMRPEVRTTDFGYQATTYTEITLDLTFVDFNYSE